MPTNEILFLLFLLLLHYNDTRVLSPLRLFNLGNIKLLQCKQTFHHYAETEPIKTQLININSHSHISDVISNKISNHNSNLLLNAPSLLDSAKN